MASKLGNITFYANDPRRLAEFWAGVFRYPLSDWDKPTKSQLLGAGLTESDLDKRALAEPAEGESGPRLFFHHADSAKTERNRLHLDIQATPGHAPNRQELEDEKDRLVALGAEVVRLVDQRWGPWPEMYYQLRDPEGNEFCLQ
ncbi:UNVERIFIED_CONTAM: VOC family protein [Microbacterium sp. SLM126]